MERRVIFVFMGLAACSAMAYACTARADPVYECDTATGMCKRTITLRHCGAMPEGMRRSCFQSLQARLDMPAPNQPRVAQAPYPLAASPSAMAAIKPAYVVPGIVQPSAPPLVIPKEPEPQPPAMGRGWAKREDVESLYRPRKATKQRLARPRLELDDERDT